MQHEEIKRQNGVYYTTSNPFHYPQFKEWFNQIPEESKESILEPFAGSNNIPALLKDENITPASWVCFDMESPEKNICPEFKIKEQDTLAHFPKGYDVCITNPPYLAKNSAKRRKLPYPETKYNDLYKLSLEKILENCKYAGAIIPESFLTQELFTDRIYSVTSLNQKMFEDTECPVCLALFVPESKDFRVFCGEEFLGYYSELKKQENELFDNQENRWKFNDREGKIGVKCIDNQKEASIYFHNGEEIAPEKIKVSSRSYTRISGLPEGIPLEAFLEKCNEILRGYREKTKDVFLTSFKGLRKDGKYRRRIDFKTLRKIMDRAVAQLVKEQVIVQKRFGVP